MRSNRAAKPLDAIAFNALEAGISDDCALLRLAYRLDVNEYRGLRTAQLVVEHLEPVS